MGDAEAITMARLGLQNVRRSQTHSSATPKGMELKFRAILACPEAALTIQDCR